MSKTMESWFFMRDGFNTFRLEPDKHKHLLFGAKERQQRDFLLGELEGASFGREGHKSVIFGDYGRGKTHMCHNLTFEIGRKGMSITPIYVKCSAYTSKESFFSLFKELITRHRIEDVKRVATEYAHRVQAGNAKPLNDIVQFEDVAMVMSRGLVAVDDDVVRNCMRWLGGEPKVSMGIVNQNLKSQITDSREFGGVLRGLAHMFVTVDENVPLYLIDEAERFENVSNADTFAVWLAALREITEIVDVGLMFFIGAKTRNNLPTLVVQDEIVRRIGVANYIEFQNPSREGLRDFVAELLSTFIRKGDVPEVHRGVVSPAALNSVVPEELQRLTGGDPARLAAFPFEPDALDEFVDQVAAGDMSSKPSEVLVRLQKAAQRAMRLEARTIDRKLVDAINNEGF